VRINDIIAGLTAAGAQRLGRDGFGMERQVFERAASARYVGQSSEIEVALPDGDISPAMIAALFAEEHEKTYGFRAPVGEPVELMGLSVMARGLPEWPRLPDRVRPLVQGVPAVRRAWVHGEGWVETPVTDRAGVTKMVTGPLIGAEGHERVGGRLWEYSVRAGRNEPVAFLAMNRITASPLAATNCSGLPATFTVGSLRRPRSHR
jgi:N-methylhydantoinase A